MTIEEQQEAIFKAVRDFCAVLRAEGVIHKPRFSAIGDADELLSTLTGMGAVLVLPDGYVVNYGKVPGLRYHGTAPLTAPDKP